MARPFLDRPVNSADFMRIAEWIDRANSLAGFEQLLETISSGGELRSIALEARPFFVAASYVSNPRKTMIVTSGYDRALAWQAKLTLCGVPQERIRQLPSGLSALFEDAAPETVALSDRIGALEALVEDAPNIIIATASSALERTLPREILDEAFVRLAVGEEIDPLRILKRMALLGYEHGEPVRLPGQFGRRGGIVDIFATGHDLPLRVEFFGDTIESIRRFDPTTQRSIASLREVRIAPSRETLFAGEMQFDTEMLLRAAESEGQALPAEANARLEELIAGDAQAIEQRTFFDRLDLYRPLLHPDSGSAIDLLMPEDLLVLDEPLELEAIASRAEEELSESLKARARRGEILDSRAHDYALPPEHLSTHPLTVSLSAMNALPEWLSLVGSAEAGCMSLEPYRGRSQALGSTLKNWVEAGFEVIVATDQPNRAASVLSQIGVFASSGEGTDSTTGALTHSESEAEGTHESVAVGESKSASKLAHSKKKGQPTSTVLLTQGNLAGGFVSADAKFALLTDAEIFGVARLRLPQKRFLEGAPIATVLDLKPGDFVVHIHFGIGVFRGLTKKTVDGVEKEFLYVEYAHPDKLFVPADQLDRIQKYLNPGDGEPKLNRLTGTEWQKTISKAREDAREFARDLVKLYAERKNVQRRPLGPDTPWQAEMEATFPWVETPSQMAAIRESKKDLLQQFPMDRLVCGDVGFGKTEVAIRVAFKVAQAGKQVAVLCPTTILSEQHFRNFSERLASFPVRLALLNRFRTTAERNQIIRDLKAGQIDLVIGTHSLLSSEIEFKDLGLVIVDEEQKFGVKQKEALKELRTNVDVLCLSATPIPRTLSMALMDIRQMSLINDPPPGRLPIRTFVRPYGEDVVREAILRELARGGQVFYVYNRVESIHHVAERLRRLAPMARIGIGHGQMKEAEIEPIMIGFIKGEIDVLLSTTIIENGIDIPNANTLIVENSDSLGLSQLYQLRGRVGRSDRQAYAYLLYQSNKELSENSMSRLQALQEFSVLGSGYSLAFRDLQIRGAGELLGKKQHGAMANVGYELYTQLIEEAVRVIKSTVDGESAGGRMSSDEVVVASSPLPMLELPVDALLPSKYIPEEAQRLYYYQRLMSCRSLEQLGEVRGEIEDRYGKAPTQARNAFTIMHLRIKAGDLGIEKVDGKGGRLSVSFRDIRLISARAFTLMGRKLRDAYIASERLIWPYSGSALDAAERLLETFYQAVQEVERDRAALNQG